MSRSREKRVQQLLKAAADGYRPSAREALELAGCNDLGSMLATAARIRDQGHGSVVTYSRKVFIPLTQLCRDVCHYCTFAQAPRPGIRPFLTPEEVLKIARAGAKADCKEALFTLGDKPELRYRMARTALSEFGHDSTLSYLADMAALVLKETGLLPHVNPGVMTARDIAALRAVSVSQGIMLESVSQRLVERGGPHFGSPDKHPSARLETIRLAGEGAVPITSGILIGIGENRQERIESLLALRELSDTYGHVQEVIIQNFRRKQGTAMARAPEPPLQEHLWTIAVARIVLGPTSNIQAPPNLRAGERIQLIQAGINDWGGVSPVTPDYVNPEAPWPHLDALARETDAAGKELVERLAIYPVYVQNATRWVDPHLRTAVLRVIDSEGFPRTDSWAPGFKVSTPKLEPRVREQRTPICRELKHILKQACDGQMLTAEAIARLFTVRGKEFLAVTAAADQLRRDMCGDVVTYVVNRNINYTNVCYFRCQFCAFSKGKRSENLRGRPYVLSSTEIARCAAEAWERGASEVCMQGGIHPHYDGATYLDICRTVKAAVPDIHVHAFSPLEVWQGANRLGIALDEFLRELRMIGLGSLPGTAAEILNDEVRRIICPDKINTEQWLQVMETAHDVGLRSTSTIMFGHIERPDHWAGHLLHIRELQARTGGFTEFVPLPFVHMEAPLYLKGKARKGPTFREAILMHAVARLALHPNITNIQTSWVKMGCEGARAALRAGANDMGGTLMNESITRAAGAAFGQEMPPEAMEGLIRSVGREPVQRSTLYARPPKTQARASFGAPPLSKVFKTPVHQLDHVSRSVIE